jgi:hypothetical protein
MQGFRFLSAHVAVLGVRGGTVLHSPCRRMLSVVQGFMLNDLRLS